MVQNEGYIEFDLKALFFYILRQWKPLLIFCTVFAVLLGSWQAVSEYNTSLEIDLENSYWAEYQQFQDQMAFCEERVATAQAKIDDLRDYIANSVLMKMDHRNVYIAKTTYYVDTDYKILPENTFQDPDMTYTLAWHYKNYLSDFSIYEEMGAELGIEAKYLMELVEVSIPNNYTISISVSHSDKDSASTIMDAVQNRLQDVHLYLSETVNEHTVSIMLDTIGVYIDEELNETQQNALDDLLELQDDILTYRDELYTLRKGPAPGELNIVAAFIKWFILGFVLAGILAVLFLFLKSILKNRLHAASQLISVFQITVLGEVIRSGKRLPALSRKINQLEGCISENSEANLQFLAENIRNHCGDAKKVLICSDTDAAFSADLAESLNHCLSGIQYMPVGDLLREAPALRTLVECDAVVMVAVRDHSRNNSIRKMLALIRSYKKECIGFILAD